MITLQEMTGFTAQRLVGVATDKDSVFAGMAWPDGVGMASHDADRSILMLGPGTCLVLGRGDSPDFDTSGLAKVTVEESGAWRLFVLEGEGTSDLIGQLSPADLHDAVDACTATHAGGHPVIILPRGADRFELLVARSYAESLLALLTPALSRT